MTDNLKFESATLRVSNLNDPNRIYDMAASLVFTPNGITQIDGGNVNRNGMMVASFNQNLDGNMNVTFYVPSSGQSDVLTAINGFIESAKSFAVENFPIEQLQPTNE